MPMSMAMAPPPVPASNSKKGLKILTAFSKKGGEDKEKASPGSAGAPISNPIVHGAATGNGAGAGSGTPGLQVPGVVMTRQGSGGIGRGGAASPGAHAM